MNNDLQRIFETLRTRQPLPPLSPSQVFSSDITKEIGALPVGEGVKAGPALHLLNDDMERCHNIAQGREGNPTFDYMHAVLHRREQDYWNSKWWINRISHPLWKECYGEEFPQTFVDDVERAEKSKDRNKITILEKKQMVELVKIVEFVIENNL
ncbi:hypothetical protein Clacol_009131 [Clathrus columnatus]|uniref:Uncharacterized protein n=1 Tax=Clathrus columnatus TaxID=1419009 RepID=A0AAV5AQA6_9AGAM|nr:hypothetical protein Clacol_009131 [Clathrus columnatus]